MAAIELQTREEKGTQAAKRIRKQSLIPGVLYGDHIDNRHFMIAANQITQIRKTGKETGLIDVQIKGEDLPVKAIVQNVQTDPVTGVYEHIDLYQVRMDKKIHTEVHLEFTGESPAVKDLAGILLKQIDALPIESLPNDLIQTLEVPIETLETFDDVIRVSDLQLPKGVTTFLDPNAIVASVSAPRSEEEIAQLDEEVKDTEGPEVTTEKKDEEAAEGESEADAQAPKDDATAEADDKSG
ncbi:MAG: 50S ribosomal protein L25, partial [Patescibacteria group bacterium]|nr:50S ribosomal protein L25 [Patescibacteria group bacterium]